LRASIARGLAMLADERHDAAQRALQDAVLEAKAEGDQEALTSALCGLARAESARNDDDAARRAAEDAYANAASVLQGDRSLRGDAAALLASIVADAGELARARDLYQEACAIFTHAAPSRSKAHALTSLATILAALGDERRSAEIAAEALTVVHALADRPAEARLLGALGSLALEVHALERATALLEQAAARSREIGSRALEARWLAALAQAWLGWGWNERAAVLFDDAERLAREEAPQGSPALVEVLWRRAALADPASRQLHVEEIARLSQRLPPLPRPLRQAIATLR
jgi:tetratricopeptide (TPR) repeat protein